MPASLTRQLSLYWRLTRFDRPIGIWLLMWPTLWALWFAADGPPSMHVLIVFVLGTALMRAAGCVINDYADRGFDAHVARTRDRPLATGEVATSQALRLFVVLCLIAFGLVASLRNPLVILLSLPAVGLAALYPFTKRWISMPQAVLGLAFSWGIPMAYAAVQHSVPWNEVLLLMAANVCWVIAYDTFYAMTDREDDLRIGVKSAAILFGAYDRAIPCALQITSIGLLGWIGYEHGRGSAYAAGLVAAALMVAHQQWLVREREPTRCFQAFLANNRFGAVIFLGLALDEMLR